MSSLKFSLVFCGGLALVGLIASSAMSQDSQPRNSGSGWDKGPVPGGPPGQRGADGPRRPRLQRGDEQGPPGPMDDDPRRGGPPRGEQGDRRGPPEGFGPGRPGENGPPRGLDGRGPDGRGPDGAGGQPPGRFGPPLDFESLKTRDPELYKAMQDDRDLERQTRDQAEQYRRADKDEQAKIKAKLTEIVDKHFAVRQQLRSLEVKRLEQQVKQLRERIDQREKDRKDIVVKRITELIGTDDAEHF